MIETNLKTIIRFLSFIDDRNRCWIWTGYITDKGYGSFSIYKGNSRTQPIPAHRYSYELFKGDIAKELTVDHLCRNRSCVNPEHLEAVTCQENILRGVGLCAINSKKTHCPQGHEYNIVNTWKDKNGGRYCKPCRRETQKRYNRRKQKVKTP